MVASSAFEKMVFLRHSTRLWPASSTRKENQPSRRQVLIGVAREFHDVVRVTCNRYEKPEARDAHLSHKMSMETKSTTKENVYH